VQSWSYLIYSLLQVQSIAIILEEAAAMVQAMVRPLVRAIRVRRLVLEHQDQALKVDRCHYTDVCQSVDSPI
jgi:hypothetical protein